MVSVFSKLTGRNPSASRIAILNAVDRFLAYFTVYMLCSLFIIDPILGGLLAFTVEGLVVRYALKRLGMK